MTRKGLVRLALVVGVVSILASAKALGVFERLSEPARLARSLADAGAWGYAAFVVTFWLLQPFGVPGTVFVFAAPLIWAWPVAFALSMVGTMGASVIGFSFARFVARDWIEPRVPARFTRYNEALERHALLTVFLLRLVFWMPQLLHAFFGISKVRGWTHFWGSLLGYLLPLFLVSYFGQRLLDAMKNAPLGVWVLVAVIVVLAWVAARVRASRRASVERAESPPY